MQDALLCYYLVAHTVRAGYFAVAMSLARHVLYRLGLSRPVRAPVRPPALSPRISFPRRNRSVSASLGLDGGLAGFAGSRSSSPERAPSGAASFFS